MKATILAAAAGILLTVSAFAGPIIYFTDGDSSQAFIVNTNTATATSFAIGNPSYPIAIVNNTIRIADRDNTASIVEYDLSGTPTGVTWANSGPNVYQTLDGTSDGVHNYSIQCCAETNYVWQADLNWQNLTPLFALPGEAAAITYDPVSGDLFTVDFGGGLFQFTLTGTLVNSFATGDNGINAGLSYDATTDTLWGLRNGSASVIQESKSGEILQTVNVESLSGNNIWGGEIASTTTTTPEPGTILLMGTAFALLGIRKVLSHR